MRIGKLEACGERSESIRSQWPAPAGFKRGSEVRRFLFWILNSIFCILASASFAQDTIKESLSELNRMLPAKKSVIMPWGRDPFIPLLGDRFGTPANLRLTAIIYNDKKSSAIINNKILYVGDSVEGQKVIDITKQYVILRGMGGSYKLEIDSIMGRSYDFKKLH